MLSCFIMSRQMMRTSSPLSMVSLSAPIEQLELGEVVAGVAEVDVLVLEPHALLWPTGSASARSRRNCPASAAAVRCTDAIQPQRREKLRRCGKLGQALPALARAQTDRAARSGCASPARAAIRS